MGLFCVSILYDTAWAVARSADTLKDYYGSEAIEEIIVFNRVLRESVTPSEPYELNLSAVREELASSGDVQNPSIGILIVQGLKTILTV